MNRKKSKKCPACNSSKYNVVEDGSFRCSRCGFVNKPEETRKS